MPNTPDRGQQQPGPSEETERQRLKDRPLEETDDDTEEGIKAPGIERPGVEEDDEPVPLRTEQGETGEDEDLPDDETTQVNSNPGSRRNDREQASEAGRKANDASD